MSLFIFGNVRKSLENCWQSLEVTQTFSQIPVMTRQKSHAFDSEKVGRYIFVIHVMHVRWNNQLVNMTTLLL